MGKITTVEIRDTLIQYLKLEEILGHAHTELINNLKSEYEGLLKNLKLSDGAYAVDDAHLIINKHNEIEEADAKKEEAKKLFAQLTEKVKGYLKAINNNKLHLQYITKDINNYTSNHRHTFWEENGEIRHD